MRRDKKVKDKRILSQSGGLMAVVEYFRDTPARDGDKTIEELFESVVLAQKFLAKFPRDMWIGSAMTDHTYREQDERRNNALGRTRDKSPATSEVQGVRPEHRGLQPSGRTFARLR